ncbi:Serine/threonine-protein kinase SRPK [Sparassis crispa]|uniref:Serine/threonine-protein kinase SRPK n=1 Tax=Sparassis crispa TaxID=139825 RepID=A0A401GQZ7_9APHY|nr:Serine/threonine-protein kinase SRPK [Sparassis crispa]GBE84632.1 Serine/threonine-protein kinase SRPK [Sparassis crispa]
MKLSLAGCSFNRNPMTHDAVAGISEVVTITESMRMKSMPTDISGEESWRNKSYALIDFGSACLLDSGRKLFSRAYPIAYRAPEVAVEAGWDTAADIWAAGCMLFSMLTHFNLYPPATDDKTLPVLQMQLFGNLPPDLIACSKKRDVFWEENGDIYAPFRITYPSFDELLQQAAPLMTPQCSDFLRRMLTVDPGKRATVQDLLGHPWLAA